MKKKSSVEQQQPVVIKSSEKESTVVEDKSPKEGVVVETPVVAEEQESSPLTFNDAIKQVKEPPSKSKPMLVEDYSRWLNIARRDSCVRAAIQYGKDKNKDVIKVNDTIREFTKDRRGVTKNNLTELLAKISAI